MPTGLIRLITTQKVLKICSNKSVKQHCLGSNHSHNRHIVGPLAMKEEESKQITRSANYVHKYDVSKILVDNAQPSTRVTKNLPNNYLRKTVCYAKSSIKRG